MSRDRNRARQVVCYFLRCVFSRICSVCLPSYVGLNGKQHDLSPHQGKDGGYPLTPFVGYYTSALRSRQFSRREFTAPSYVPPKRFVTKRTQHQHMVTHPRPLQISMARSSEQCGLARPSSQSPEFILIYEYTSLAVHLKLGCRSTKFVLDPAQFWWRTGLFRIRMYHELTKYR